MANAERPGPPPAVFADLAAGNTTTFVIDGWEFDVSLPTWRLLDALAAGDVYAVVPGGCPPEQRRELLAAISDAHSGVNARLLARIACAVIERLCGCPWWSAMSLAAALRAQWWAFDAHVRLSGGADLLAWPVRRILPVVYGAVSSHLDEGKRIELDNQIWLRPPGADDVDGQPRALAAAPARKTHIASPEQQYASFKAFTAMAGRYANAAG